MAALSAGAAQPAEASGGKKRPLALILEPTRDLAEQTHNCLVQMGRHLSSHIHSVLITGSFRSLRVLKLSSHIYSVFITSGFLCLKVLEL